jgi:hypothetical protein
VPGWDNKPTQGSTGYMLSIKFKGLLILRLGNQRRLAKPLSSTRLAFLSALPRARSGNLHPVWAPNRGTLISAL